MSDVQADPLKKKIDRRRIKLRRRELAELHRQYLLGEKSVHTLAAEYDLHVETIGKYARENGWDIERVAIAERVKAIADAKAAAQKTIEVEQRNAESLVASQNMVQAVLLEHRSAIRGAKQLCGTLLLQLQDAIMRREEIEDEIIAETSGDRGQARRAAMLAAVSLPVHIGSMEKLARAYDTWIELEREAFGIAKDEGREQVRDTFREFLDQLGQRSPSLAPPSNEPTPPVVADAIPPRTEVDRTPTTSQEASAPPPPPNAEPSGA